MNVVKNYPKVLILFAFIIVGIAVFTTRVEGQDEGWRIVRATYGYRSQVADVTAQLLQLISTSGADGKIFVSNETLGGDPAPERVKTLRIYARNSRNEEREFDYDEKGYMDVHPFLLRREDPDRYRHEDRREGYREREDDWRDRDDFDGVRIIRGFYGVNGSTVNVTERLRSMSREDGGISMKVNNTNIGVDAAPGVEKILIVIYRFQHREQALVLREGDMLNLP
jgi:hypothetical protein